jgi:hypothetical protein
LEPYLLVADFAMWLFRFVELPILRRLGVLFINRKPVALDAAALIDADFVAAECKRFFYAISEM